MDFPVKYSTDRTRLYDIIDTEYKNDSFRNLFYGMQAEVFRVPFDTSNVTDMAYMFQSCGSLKCILDFDTSNVTDMAYMFSGDQSLIVIPQLNTSKVTNMRSMFDNCKMLTSIPQLDTSKVTDMRSMFDNCKMLTSIPQLDTSKVTDMEAMFNSCSALTSIPQFDTSNVKTMNNMFSVCYGLTSIPQFDCSKIEYIGLFGYSGNANVVDLGGFVNLGMQKSLSGTTNNNFLGASSKLTHDSIMNVINNLYDRKTAGYSVITLKLHANTMALLSDEEKAIATNKGWTLS